MIQLYYIYMILHPVTDKLLQFHCKMAKAPQAQIVFELPPSFQFPGNWACVWHEKFCKKLLWMKQSFQYLQRVGLFWSCLPVLPGTSRSWFLNTCSLDLWPPSSWTLEIQLRVNTSFISITFRTYVTISYWRVHSCTIWRSVKVLWWLEHFLAARCAFSDRNPITLDSSEKKNHPNSAPQKSCTYSFRNAHYLDAGWPTQTQKFFLQTQMQGFMLFSLLLFRVETEEFSQRLYLYVFLTTWWQSLTKVVHHKLRTAIMSPSLEYCRMPASTPICVRMVLVEL